MADLVTLGGSKMAVDPSTIPIPETEYEFFFHDGAVEKVKGFITVMGPDYYVGRGTPGQVTWHFVAPSSNIMCVKSTSA